MAENKDAPFLGGFQVLSDIISGGQSQEGGRTDVSQTATGDVDDEADDKGVTDLRTNTEDPSVQDVDPDFFTKNKEEDEEESDEDADEKEETGETEETDESEEEEDSDDSGESDEDDGKETDDDLGKFEEDITKVFKEKLSDLLGWDFSQMEEEPKSVEEMVDFMRDLVDENSKPQYANEDVQKYDEFVKNGGDLRKFYQETMDGRIDLEQVDIASEVDQKRVIRQNLKNQGVNDSIIEKRLKRYDEAGVLEEEAEEALEIVKEHDTKLKGKLLEEQQKYASDIEKQQQKFVNDVEKNITDLADIKGIKITGKEKKELRDYILVADADGMTKYQKDYLSDVNNLLESAYFTKNKDALLDRAKRQGSSDSLRDLQKKLNQNKGNKTKNSKRQNRDNLDIKSLGSRLGVI